MTCLDCYASPPCGGMTNLFSAIGCCHGCAAGTCDYTCPNNRELYRRRLADVNGLDDYRISRVVAPEGVGFPRYIPLIHHGSSRQVSLACDVVAVPLFKTVCHLDRKTYGCRFKSADELLRYFRVQRPAQVILCGIAPDRQLEWFWHRHRKFDIADFIQRLGCVAVTAPNFSFFSDYPRYHILYNRKRILLAMERLSIAGVAVIPHLNALTQMDWDFWLSFLREHSSVSVVIKEFQTGNRPTKPGDESFDKIVELQQQLGRPLHPILVAGSRYYGDAAKSFKTFSILDSRPFLQSMNRTRLAKQDGRWDFVPNPLPQGHPVDELLAYNVEKYSEKLSALPRPDGVKPFAADGNLMFEFATSMPTFTAQPVAPGIS